MRGKVWGLFKHCSARVLFELSGAWAVLSGRANGY